MRDQRRSERTLWVAWFAWASMAVPAWERMLFLVKVTISSAMSASRMRDSAALRFSVVTLMLLMVCSNRFWMAPSSERCAEIWVIAFWTVPLSRCRA